MKIKILIVVLLCIIVSAYILIGILQIQNYISPLFTGTPKASDIDLLFGYGSFYQCCFMTFSFGHYNPNKIPHNDTNYPLVFSGHLQGLDLKYFPDIPEHPAVSPAYAILNNEKYCHTPPGFGIIAMWNATGTFEAFDGTKIRYYIPENDPNVSVTGYPVGVGREWEFDPGKEKKVADYVLPRVEAYMFYGAGLRGNYELKHVLSPEVDYELSMWFKSDTKGFCPAVNIVFHTPDEVSPDCHYIAYSEPFKPHTLIYDVRDNPLLRKPYVLKVTFDVREFYGTWKQVKIRFRTPSKECWECIDFISIGIGQVVATARNPGGIIFVDDVTLKIIDDRKEEFFNTKCKITYNENKSKYYGYPDGSPPYVDVFDLYTEFPDTTYYIRACTSGRAIVEDYGDSIYINDNPYTGEPEAYVYWDWTYRGTLIKNRNLIEYGIYNTFRKPQQSYTKVTGVKDDPIAVETIVVVAEDPETHMKYFSDFYIRDFTKPVLEPLREYDAEVVECSISESIKKCLRINGVDYYYTNYLDLPDVGTKIKVYGRLTEAIETLPIGGKLKRVILNEFVGIVNDYSLKLNLVSGSTTVRAGDTLQFQISYTDTKGTPLSNIRVRIYCQMHKEEAPGIIGEWDLSEATSFTLHIEHLSPMTPRKDNIDTDLHIYLANDGDIAPVYIGFIYHDDPSGTEYFTDEPVYLQYRR